MPDRRDMPNHSTSRAVEVCGNPWNGRCDGSDIALYIYYDGRLIQYAETAGARYAEWTSHGIAGSMFDGDFRRLLEEEQLDL